MRILFIHGFGEDEAIFSKITPAIAGEHVLLNVWDLLGNEPRPDINVLDFSKEIVDKYAITKGDVIIGHSMGGWIAYHIKQITGSPIIQIASWTHFGRVILPISKPSIIYWSVRNGLFFNRFQKGLYTFFGYQNKPSKEIFRTIFDRLIESHKENTINQLRLILTPVPEQVSIQPDLRIHAQKDIVIRPPREPFHLVSGDHFTLYTSPQEVYEPIVAFLEQ